MHAHLDVRERHVLELYIILSYPYLYPFIRMCLNLFLILIQICHGLCAFEMNTINDRQSVYNVHAAPDCTLTSYKPTQLKGNFDLYFLLSKRKTLLQRDVVLTFAIRLGHLQPVCSVL